MWRLKLYIIKQRYPKLFTEEYKQAKANGYTKIESTLEEPLVGPIMSGDVIHRSPMTQAEFNKLGITTIISNLKTTWPPVVLAENNKGGDPFNPLAPDAIGDLIQNDFPNRPQAYLDLASSFFDHSIHLHYTHRYLSAIREYVKNNRAKASQLAWGQPILLISTILASKRIDPRKERGSWLANWDWVFSSICELLTELLAVEGDTKPIDFDTYRSDILSQLDILFAYQDPTPADENIKTATSITSSYGDKEKEITDPYAMAINSVRGKAHRALLGFVYRDGKELRNDVKDLYEKIIESEDTRAIYFLFGHQLPPFYYRDKVWTQKIIQTIFRQPKNKSLSLAAWEGYLSNNLYHEIFNEPDIQMMYSEAIGKSRAYPSQKFFLDPQKGLAGHLALAFMYYPEFNSEHTLLKKFWENGTSTEQSEFITLIGRNLTSNQDKRYLTNLKENQNQVDNLKKLWSYLLSNKYDSVHKSEVLKSFGYWVGPENDVLEPNWLAPQIKETIGLTKGRFNWDYGLTQMVVKLAQVSPKEVVDIARLFFENLINDSSRHPTERYVEKEWKQALEIAYKEGQQERVKLLIDQLITKGGRSFWTLKDILCEDIK